MRFGQNQCWKIVILLGAFLIVSVACTAEEAMCSVRGGDWRLQRYDTVRDANGEEKKVAVYGCDEGKALDMVLGSGPVIDSDGDDTAAIQPAAPDPDAESKPETASQPQPESEVSEEPLPPEDEAPSAPATVASCIPQPGEYKIDIVDVNDRKSGSGDKRVCSAEGQLINKTEKELMIAAYRVHNANGWDYEKWTNPGYTIISAKGTVEFAEFYRCTGNACGDEGAAWYYFPKVSILYHTPECLELAFSQEEKIPESIVPVENPCSW